MTDTEYSRGASTYRKPRARFETKPVSYFDSGRRDTGAGYERWRSYEATPDRDGKRDVYVYVHRLAATVWCYPDEMSTTDVLAHLDGKDVHHESGFAFDNRETNLSVVDHGRHAEITQAQMRAWAEDAKPDRDRQRTLPADDADECDECGDREADLCSVAGDDRDLCLSCATRVASESGATIQL